jgi:hypothetical protein
MIKRAVGEAEKMGVFGLKVKTGGGGGGGSRQYYKLLFFEIFELTLHPKSTR